MPDFIVLTLDERPDLIDAADKLASETGAWPEFMLHDPIASKYFWRLYDTFPAYQTVLMDSDGQLVAMGNTIPVTWDGTTEGLPDEGWDAILERGVLNFRNQIPPNCVSAIQAVVAPEHMGQGISKQIVRAMRRMVAHRGLNKLIAPVRPNLKHAYPLTPMERYIQWKRNDGSVFDPWLRTHVRMGASILKVCPRSMTINAPVAAWEGWTLMRFPDSGQYIVPGALAPVIIDRESDKGTYIEPNVWVLHEIGGD
ncbi:MAG: GNAT family N-acetyltransferase [Anaerolineaceae bacterium]|nr:GNAT family N-acetyltransferase [Anaerolineaceae bacterium]